jgi:peptide/nickel transport system ATP-binding protein
MAAIAQRGAVLIVITHDLRLAERLGGRLALIYASYIVELRSTKKFFSGPLHSYGRALLDALPERGGRPIPGLSPEPTALPEHCPFAFRCEHRLPRCMESMPQPTNVAARSNMTRCFLYAES